MVHRTTHNERPAAPGTPQRSDGARQPPLRQSIDAHVVHLDAHVVHRVVTEPGGKFQKYLPMPAVSRSASAVGPADTARHATSPTHFEPSSLELDGTGASNVRQALDCGGGRAARRWCGGR